jgi:hypothetical protein
MTTPVLFLTDETGIRTGVIIEISHYNALLKKLGQLRSQQENAGTSNEKSPDDAVAGEQIGDDRDLT